MTNNVGIGFATGRKNFQNVLKAYINNWLEYGLINEQSIRLHLFIAYDLKYQNTQIEDYRNIEPSLKEMLASITYIGEQKTKEEAEILIARGLVNEKEAGLVFGEGYAKKRNSILYFAIKSKMDKLIFLDDDEYPVAVFKSPKEQIFWMGQSIVGTHLKFNSKADITHGHHCGYISPIPRIVFNDTLSEVDFRLFIETISNDIISWEKIKESIIENNGITYASEDIITNPATKEVAEINGMKFISGANICFNLKKNSKIPPFYNPPGARGEDTFMSTCLSELKVLKVPCYAFHDGFSTCGNILNGVLPVHFSPVHGNTEFEKNRFIRAALGWIRYKPLLLYITQKENYPALIEQIKRNLLQTLPKLCGYFKTNKFEQLLAELKYYDKNVQRHFTAFEETKKVWTKIIKV